MGEPRKTIPQDQGKAVFRSLHRAIVRLWLRQFRKRKMVPSVRAVFLGDAVSTQITLDGIYEKYELDALAKELFPKLSHPSVCLDVGANIGNHSSFFAGHFDRVVALEPNPMIYSVLVANVMGRNVTPVPEGLSDKRAKLWFRQDFANLGASHIVDDKAESNFEIDVRSLDDLAAELGLTDVSFIKLDVERHEAAVLRGGMNFLKARKPVLAMEAFFEHDPKLGQEIAELLNQAGYRHYYRLAPVSKLTRRLENTFLSPHRGIMRVLLPERIRKAVCMERVDDIRNANHQLLICSHSPLK